jgi:hypothetical protein
MDHRATIGDRNSGGIRRESQNDERKAGNRQRQIGLIETCVYLGLVKRTAPGATSRII